MSAPGPCNRLVLVVDDDEEIREILRELLEAEGYAVMTAAHGKAGLEALRADGRPCLILLDLMMPVMSGGEFLGVLRRDERLTAIPVVVVSAWPKEAAQVGAQAQGFMEKPVTLDAVLQCIERFCGRPCAGRPARPAPSSS